jgi:hypothetical protein
MKTTNGTSMDASAVPLARDANGNVISLPNDAAAWGVRRDTGGRPRRLLGLDRKWLRFPLDTTIEDVEAMLGPGAYRLDLVNEDGSPLGVTVPVMIGVEAEPEPTRPPMPRTDEPLVTLPSSGTDLRMLLEANVRAMQLSFQHNERTLETSLRVVDSLRDGVRVLADAQSQWIKALASTHTIRNAPYYPVPRRDDDDDDDDDEGDENDEEDEEEEPPTFWGKLGEQLLPYQDVIAATVKNKVTDWVTGRKGARNGGEEDVGEKTPPPPAPPPRRNGKSKLSKEPTQAELLALVMQKIDAAKKILTANEIALLRHMLSKMPDTERDRWITQLAPLSVEDAIVQIRIALSQIGMERDTGTEPAAPAGA